MSKSRPHRAHLRSSADLETSYEAIRAGFVSLALEKNRRATPFVAQARSLKVAASDAKSPTDLIKIEEIQSALLTAAGVSDKAAGHLRPEDKAAAILGLVENFLAPAGENFVEELVFRFLLTRGDTLGGSMRNVGGVLAQRKLSRALISSLAVAGTGYRWLHAANNSWTPMTDDDSDIELQLRGLSWTKARRRRTVIFNMTVPFLKNNVDLCLFNCVPEDLQANVGSPAAYVALGELKGGIDPAGADEHWKTARTALTRIRFVFEQRGMKPHTFFVGAAIAKKMAQEIWADLESGTLENAANLTVDAQVASVSSWLCKL
ncbi:MAG TPA: AvaI/BsoBI family type II restriction endonuclease [Pyrinomonadaceae bacterium]|nr:AvaI/BsoBI family type II restriction endonuclease [Pyrinomonadaceae bacterium]